MIRWIVGILTIVLAAQNVFAQGYSAPPGYGYPGTQGYGGYGNYGTGPAGYGGGYGGYGGGYQGGYVAPGSSPLSPYLNLFRSNPAVNFYNSVRPTTGAGSYGGGGGGGAFFGFNQNRAGFIPAAANPTQNPTPIPDAGSEIPSLPSAAHPVVYGSTGLAGASRGVGTRPGGNTQQQYTPPPASKGK